MGGGSSWLMCLALEWVSRRTFADSLLEGEVKHVHILSWSGIHSVFEVYEENMVLGGERSNSFRVIHYMNRILKK